jgi:hypothetical protein
VTTPLTVPQPVRNATLAVWAILALLVLRAILTFAFSDDLLDAWVDRDDNSRALPRELAEASAPAYSGVAIGVLVVGLLLAVVALNLRKAARWAQITAIVLAALSVLGAAASLVTPTLVVLLVINVATGVLAIAVIVLLVTRAANGFFASGALNPSHG